MAKTIVVGADHGGFNLKEKLKKLFKKRRYKIIDVGAFSDESCDYPVFGFNAAKKVSSGKALRGIVICKTGIGMTIVANKFPRVRAGLCHTVDDARSARMHNDINVLVLAATKLTYKNAKGIVEVYLKTKALGGRHHRRVKQIIDLERKIFRKG